MANENFGLSYTIEDVTLWNESNLSPTSSLFVGDIVLFDNATPTVGIFADLALLENVTPTTGMSASGICAAPSILEAGGPSSSLGPGGGNNILSCP